MFSDKTGIEEEIKYLEFDTRSAQHWAGEGRIEEWVHKYLSSGSWANVELLDGLKQKKRWWNGPMEVKLSDLSPAVGVEPKMEFRVDQNDWHARINELAKSFSDPASLPPLIAEYRGRELSVRDGNTRYGAMRILGWSKCWVIFWYNSESDFVHHNEILLEQKTA